MLNNQECGVGAVSPNKSWPWPSVFLKNYFQAGQVIGVNRSHFLLNCLVGMIYAFADQFVSDGLIPLDHQQQFFSQRQICDECVIAVTILCNSSPSTEEISV